jgi:hypothetical protein
MPRLNPKTQRTTWVSLLLDIAMRTS